MRDYRSFLSREAKCYLMLKGLDPFKESVLEELGIVLWFYERNLDLLPNENFDLFARRLGIQPGLVNNQELLPGQKFEIYTGALMFCYPDET